MNQPCNYPIETVQEWFLNNIVSCFSSRKRFAKVISLLAIFILLVSQATASKPARRVYPKISVQGNGNQYPLKLRDLNIRVEITGNIALTTYEMVFLNNENRVLEGELEFPLGEGQTISRFAMDMGGKLREGVVVEKAKGRETFEKIVRRGVDPGLLEQTQGNVFRSRVYPIPAKGTKTIVVAYEQELTWVNNKPVYLLPLQFESRIENFNLSVEVPRQPFKLFDLENKFKGLVFAEWNEIYKAKAEYKDYCPDQQLALIIPQQKNTPNVYTEPFNDNSGNSYFYLILNPEKRQPEKQLPSKVCIVWDASSSSAKKDIDLELELLQGYFGKIGTLTAELVVFRNVCEQPVSFNIKNGNCSELLTYLKNIKYDGGTQIGSLNLRDYSCDEFLLFSDGMSNFGESELKTTQTPVNVITSNIVADFSFLKHIAASSGGKFINLNKISLKDALIEVTTQEFRFISAVPLKSFIAEMYPSIPTAFGTSFGLSGKMIGQKGRLIVNFGTGNKIMHSDTVEIQASNSQGNGILKRLWAEKAIAELDMRYEKNKEQITRLGKQYGIVTRNTSLIVLDRLEDYVDNQIEPPADMLDSYRSRIDNMSRIKRQEDEGHLENIIQQFLKRQEWWDQKPLVYLNQDLPVSTANTPNINNRNIPQNINPNGGNVNVSRDNRRSGRISGTITDAATGEPVPGVNIVIEGTTQGVVSDFEGKYFIDAPPNKTLVFSFIGYITEKVSVGNNNRVNVVMVQDVVSLDEVVVVGYGTIQKSDLTGSVSSVSPSSARKQKAAKKEEAGDMNSETIAEEEQPKASIILNAWDPNALYLSVLKQVDKTEIYNTYLELKKEYEKSPSFFLDVADLLYKNQQPELALRVLSNIAELQTENHQLLRVLAHRLQQLGQYNLAVKTFRDVLKIREEEPQSYRDLALALADNKQPQEAIDVLYRMILKKWDGRFPGIELIAAGELNNMVANNSGLDISKIDKRLIRNLPVDVRVVLNWDADNCDMDLWVTTPEGEKCYYGNKATQKGGRISNDFTGGYGPEEFMIKKATTGAYKIEVNYFGSHEQKITGPTTIQVELYTGYGTPSQKKQELTLRLDEAKQVVKVGELKYE